MNYGRFEGLTTDEIRETDPEWELYRDGCQGGETPDEIYVRARAFVDAATAAQPDGGVAIAFSHGHILRAIAVAWIGADITVAAHLQLDVATLSVLRATDRGNLVGLWNAS